MKILFFGDIVAKPGREAVIAKLPELREKHAPDFVIGNVENLAHGHGITPPTVQELLDAGFDAMTSGNHIYKKEAGYPLLNDPEVPVVRPENFEQEDIGRGHMTLPFASRKLLIINLMGVAFMKDESTGNPYKALDAVLEQYKDERLAGVLVDFHAEVTSEKRAMGLYADGRASVVVGTHTHVQTNDAEVLEGGTGYLTDAGMCGVTDQLIGASSEVLIPTFVEGEPFRYRVAEGRREVSYFVADIDETIGHCRSIEAHKEAVA